MPINFSTNYPANKTALSQYGGDWGLKTFKKTNQVVDSYTSQVNISCIAQ